MKTVWTDRLPLLMSLALLAHLAFMLYAYSAGYLQRLEQWVTDIDGNPHGLLVSAGDNQIRLWQQRRCITTFVSPQERVRCLSLSADGAVLASGGADYSILIWSVSKARPIQRLLAHRKPVTQVLISPDRQWLISQSEDSTLCIWQLPAGKLVKRLASLNTGFSLSSSGGLAYCNRQANLVVVDLKTQTILWQVPQVTGKPLFTPAGNQLAWIDTANHCSIFDAFTHQRIVTFPLGTHVNWTFCFTPDSKQLLVSKWGGSLEVWDWKLAKKLTQFDAYTMASVQDLRFDESGHLQTAGNGSIKYWNLATQELLFSVGDGAYRQTLLSWLGFLVMLSLATSYIVLVTANEPSYARYTILGILTVWSLGLFLLLDQVRSWVSNWALSGLWTMASLTLLSFVLYYFSFISFVTIPLGFYFGYVYLLRRSHATWSFSLLPLVILLGSTFLLINSLDSVLSYILH